MSRTFTNTPEPRYVERAKHCDNPGGAVDLSTITKLLATNEGVELEFEDGSNLLLPLVGSEQIVVDVSEDGMHIDLHFDQTITSKLARVLVTPPSAPTATSVVAIDTNNGQQLLTLQELATLLKPLLGL